MASRVEELHQKVTSWLRESRQRVLTGMNTQLAVQTKTSRKDLVTNVDKANQTFLVQCIHRDFPQAKIEGEEGTASKVAEQSGLIFFVDPIDGTMNFVKQRANFAIMIGVYEDGQPLYGAILDVMRAELVAGGPNFPPQLNGKQMALPADLPLADTLIGVNGPMLMHNYLHVADIVEASSGGRMSGSAGMEFKAITQGQLIGYISHLQPWDVAAGMAIGAGFGLVVTREDGSPIDILHNGIVVAAMPKAHAEIIDMMQQ